MKVTLLKKDNDNEKEKQNEELYWIVPVSIGEESGLPFLDYYSAEDMEKHLFTHCKDALKVAKNTIKEWKINLAIVKVVKVLEAK